MAEQRKCKKLVAVLVEHQECFSTMSDENCQWAIQNPKDAIALFANAVKNRVEAETKKLLRFLRTISFPAIDKFVTAEKFREGETVDGIKVAWLGENFKANFLTKVEKSVPALGMKEHELVTPSRDPAIIIELGGEEQVESFLAHFWEFLKTVDKRFWYVAYIRDTENVLWAVRAGWRSGGLDAEAYSLGSPSDWRAGSRVLSR